MLHQQMAAGYSFALIVGASLFLAWRCGLFRLWR